MSILIGVAVFLVWYLVGLLTGLVILSKLDRLDMGNDWIAWLVASLMGPIVWLLIIVTDILENLAE